MTPSIHKVQCSYLFLKKESFWKLLSLLKLIFKVLTIEFWQTTESELLQEALHLTLAWGVTLILRAVQIGPRPYSLGPFTFSIKTFLFLRFPCIFKAVKSLKKIFYTTLNKIFGGNVMFWNGFSSSKIKYGYRLVSPECECKSCSTRVGERLKI